MNAFLIDLPCNAACGSTHTYSISSFYSAPTVTTTEYIQPKRRFGYGTLVFPDWHITPAWGDFRVARCSRWQPFGCGQALRCGKVVSRDTSIEREILRNCLDVVDAEAENGEGGGDGKTVGFLRWLFSSGRRFRQEMKFVYHGIRKSGWGNPLYEPNGLTPQLLRIGSDYVGITRPL